MLGAVVENFVAWDSMVPEFCASLPCVRKYKIISLHSSTTSGIYVYKMYNFVCYSVAAPTFSDGALQKIFKPHIL
jgi:hypothetical protein